MLEKGIICIKLKDFLFDRNTLEAQRLLFKSHLRIHKEINDANN